VRTQIVATSNAILALSDPVGTGTAMMQQEFQRAQTGWMVSQRINGRSRTT
jgi:hypothetical protein